MEAASVIDFGLRPGEFWRLTPRQYRALQARRQYRDAVFIAAYANTKRGQGQAPVKPEDLVPRPQSAPGCLGPEVFAGFEQAFRNG